MTRSAAVIALIASLGVGQFALNRSLVLGEGAWVIPPDHQENPWHPQIFKTLSFGQLATAVDWLWLKTLQEEELFHVPEGVHPPSFYATDLATDLDPDFFEGFWVAGNHLAIIRADTEGAIKILDKGIAHAERLRANGGWELKPAWRQVWRLLMIRGYLELYERQDLARSSASFEAAGGMPGAPEFLKKLALRLAQPGGRFEVGVRILTHLLDTTPDIPANAVTRERIFEKLAALRREGA